MAVKTFSKPTHSVKLRANSERRSNGSIVFKVIEAQGKDEYAEQGEIKGKTKSGKEYKGAYGFRAKVGLRPSKSGLTPRILGGRRN